MTQSSQEQLSHCKDASGLHDNRRSHLYSRTRLAVSVGHSTPLHFEKELFPRKDFDAKPELHSQSNISNSDPSKSIDLQDFQPPKSRDHWRSDLWLGGEVVSPDCTVADFSIPRFTKYVLYSHDLFFVSDVDFWDLIFCKHIAPFLILHL